MTPSRDVVAPMPQRPEIKVTESIPSPENIPGHNFTIPSIKRVDYGRFALTGLALPHNWQESTPTPLLNTDLDYYASYYLGDLRFLGYFLSDLSIDKETGLIISVTVKKEDSEPAGIYLVQEENELQGTYQTPGISDPCIATALQRLIATHLDTLTIEDGILHPHVRNYGDGLGKREIGKWGSEWLKYPKGLPGIDRDNRDILCSFQDRASAIAAQFGAMFEGVNFNNQGIITRVQVGGNACFYQLSYDGQYYGHNVDRPYQAMALHAIVAEFINNRLKAVGR